MSSRLFRCFVFVLLLWGVMPAGVLTSTAVAQETELWQSQTYKHAVLDRLVRTSIVRFRHTPNPTANDHRLLALVLEFAAREWGDDLYLWRRSAEAWRGVLDTRRELAALRQVLRLDPHDTVTQLRLLTASIEKLDTVEARIARYDRMLGPAGARLDESIRSRLAFDAAMLQRELGDESTFLRRLTLSTQLDSTNIDAATMAASVGLSKTTDPLSRIELLANVVLADPVRYVSYLALADEFLSHGAYKAALRFYKVAAMLAQREQTRLEERSMLHSKVAQWGVLGPEHVLQTLQDDEAKALYAIEQQQKAAEKGDLDPSEVMVFESVEAAEILQFFLGLTLDDDDAVTKSLARLATMTQDRIDAYRDLQNSGEATEQEISLGIFTARSDFIWRALLANKQLDDASVMLDSLKNVEIDLPAIRNTTIRLQSLMLFRQDQPDQARTMLSSIASEDALANVGLALLYESLDQPANAAQAMARVVQQRPGEPISLWANSRIEALLGQPVNKSPIAASLESYAQALPETIDAYALNPSRWLDLRVEPVETILKPTDRMELRFTLSNRSTVALGVGEQRAVSTRYLCAPRLSLSGQLAHQLALPEVVQLATRLRLKPGESIQETVWVGSGELGEAVMRLLQFPAAIRWRVMQGFEETQGDRFTNGPHSVAASAELIIRPVGDHATSTIASLVGTLEEGNVEDTSSAIMISGFLFLHAEGQTDPNELFRLRTALANALTTQLDRFPSIIQALLLLQMPTANDYPELRQFDDVSRSTLDPFTQLAILLTRVTQSDDPFLDHVRQTAANPILLEIVDTLTSLLRLDDSQSTDEAN
jgi:hypothetical protein